MLMFVGQTFKFIKMSTNAFILVALETVTEILKDKNTCSSFLPYRWHFSHLAPCGQSLLQWTGKEHPDCSLLLGTERALRGTLSRCHVILEEDVRWGEGGGQRSEHHCLRGRYVLTWSTSFGACLSVLLQCLTPERFLMKVNIPLNKGIFPHACTFWVTKVKGPGHQGQIFQKYIILCISWINRRMVMGEMALDILTFDLNHDVIFLQKKWFWRHLPHLTFKGQWLQYQY